MMTQRKRQVGSLKSELVKKSREAIMAAVQIYNNPQITFKTECFISLVIIAWTYLLHAYYRQVNVDYRYYKIVGSRKRYDKTKHGAYKHWELERCLDFDLCPIDNVTKTNLKFLIGLRHEIEHQMTGRIDEQLSAKLQACCINYNCYIKQFFGLDLGIDKELSLAIQFSPLLTDQVEQLRDIKSLSRNVLNFITSYEKNLDEADLYSTRYAYRIVFLQVNVNRKGQADRVVEFIKSDSPLAQHVNKEYALIKETEKKKYLPSQIIKMMKEQGYIKFTVNEHAKLWQAMNAKEPQYGFGANVAGKTWYWYDNWLTVVKQHCEDNKEQYAFTI